MYKLKGKLKMKVCESHTIKMIQIIYPYVSPILSIYFSFPISRNFSISLAAINYQ